MERLLLQSPVLPVVTIHDPEDAVPVARALYRGGINIVEITLRTECAFEAIRLIHKQLPQVSVGGGTITTEAQLEQLQKSHAKFAVSPGLTVELLRRAKAIGMPYLPGITSVSELMVGLNEGYECFKFFPAVASGGIKTLKSLAGPFHGIKFCPTGGINQDNFEQYLALPNCVSVGGSWLTPQDLIERRDWAAIERFSREVMQRAGRSQDS
jgi:2-dehydro-3-deoxyphosphogluconate aldolase/(4S)-4-hydroxy-2-oxoglutarate aldolase